MTLRLFFLLLLYTSNICNASELNLLTISDIKDLPYQSADHRIYYDNNKHTFGDLYLPNTQDKSPLIIVIHGGCWKSQIANLDFMSPFAKEFTKHGFAVWNLEYRCVDNPGGGWPGTFIDISNGVNFARDLALSHNIDLNKVVIIGHSSGGHLALWAASRHKLLHDGHLSFIHNSLPIKGVINLSGPGDLESFLQIQEFACKEKIIHRLLSNQDTIDPTVLKQTSPYEALPLGVKQILITGSDDLPASEKMMERYVNKATSLGDDAKLITIDGTGHFEVVAPNTNAFFTILQQVKNMTQPNTSSKTR